MRRKNRPALPGSYGRGLRPRWILICLILPSPANDLVLITLSLHRRFPPDLLGLNRVFATLYAAANGGPVWALSGVI